MTILDWLTLISYMALNIDIILQIGRIYKRKSSEDLSLVGMTIRFIAILIIAVKFFTLGDVPLIIGQGMAVVTFGTYFVLAIIYFRHRRAKSSS